MYGHQQPRPVHRACYGERYVSRHHTLIYDVQVQHDEWYALHPESPSSADCCARLAWPTFHPSCVCSSCAAVGRWVAVRRFLKEMAQPVDTAKLQEMLLGEEEVRERGADDAARRVLP